ncbi:MAG: hypothetical protein SOV27_02570 [Eubacteriales bacterium]|nr:hypothetical protein [Eubacteriales bacterium]
MQEYIGEKLSVVINKLSNLRIKYKVVDNNFSVLGDEKLVTNIYTQDDTVVIITGDFIFDVRNKNNESK